MERTAFVVDGEGDGRVVAVGADRADLADVDTGDADRRLGGDAEGRLDLVTMIDEGDRLGEGKEQADDHEHDSDQAEDDRTWSSPVAEELLVVARGL